MLIFQLCSPRFVRAEPDPLKPVNELDVSLFLVLRHHFQIQVDVECFNYIKTNQLGNTHNNFKF